MGVSDKISTVFFIEAGQKAKLQKQKNTANTYI
jgi:hypothetical protein